MPGIDFLRLEDARDDSPQARSMLGLFEEDAALFTNYVNGLHVVCRKVMECENALSIAVQALSKKLKDYGNLGFPLGRDDSILASTLKQFATTMEEVSSVHTAHASQLNDLMVQPLASFTNNELNEINTMKELTRILDQEHENSTSKYCRVSKKKENETKARIEANEELFQCRKKILQNSLMYYNSMNMLQYKRTTGLLEPMLGFFQAQLSFFRMGKETLTKQTEEYLSDITTSVQSVHSEMGKLSQESSDKMREIQEKSVYYFMPEPTPDMQMQPRLVKTNLSQTAGYLMIRSKSGLTHRWERQYFFTQGGNLMSHAKGQIAGSLVIDLDGCTVNSADVDDRRFIFQVTRPEDTKKLVSLQCMSGSDREEWISTIRNISSGFYMSERPPENGQPQSQGNYEVRSRTLSAPPIPGAMTIPSSQGQGDSPTHSSYSGGTRPKHPMSLSNVPQKQRAESFKSSAKERSRSSDTSQCSSQDVPATPPPSPFDSVLSSTPIQFDMISPSEEQLPPVRHAPPQKDVPQRRLNPFGDSPSDSRPIQVSGATDAVGFVPMYVLRFLGSMEVSRDKGLDVVMDTIRKIMAARAIHNIFKMTELNIVVTSNYIRLLDSGKQIIKAHHDLQDVSFWAAHQENKRLFAFISSTKTLGTSLQAQFMCHVFESDVMADEICKAISLAADIAFQSLLQQRTTAMAVAQRQEKTPLSDSPNLVLAPTTNQPMMHHNQPQTTQHSNQQHTPQLHNQPPQHTTSTSGSIPIHTIPTDDQVGPAFNTNKNNSSHPVSPYSAQSSDTITGLEGLHLGHRMEEETHEKPLILDESDA